MSGEKCPVKITQPTGGPVRRNASKGGIPIRKVAIITLGIAVIVVVYAGVTGAFDAIIGGFVDQVNYDKVQN